MEEPAVWFRIVAPHFVAGIRFKGEKCVNAAPILMYARRMTKSAFLAYCRQRKWTVEELKPKGEYDAV